MAQITIDWSPQPISIEGFIAELSGWRPEIYDIAGGDPEVDVVSDERAEQIRKRVLEIIDQLNACGKDSRLMQELAGNEHMTLGQYDDLIAELEGYLAELKGN